MNTHLSHATHTAQLKSPQAVLVDAHSNPVDLSELASRIFHIANTLDVLGRALPDDLQGETPARSLVTKLATMTEAIAIEVSEYVIEGDAA